MIEIKEETVLPLAFFVLYFSALREIEQTLAWNSGAKMTHLSGCGFFINCFRKNSLKLAHMDWIWQKWAMSVTVWTFFCEKWRFISEWFRQSLKSHSYHLERHKSRREQFWDHLSFMFLLLTCSIHLSDRSNALFYDTRNVSNSCRRMDFYRTGFAHSFQTSQMRERYYQGLLTARAVINWRKSEKYED